MYQLLSLTTLKPDELAGIFRLPTKYYSCLAIVMHLLRDNARDIWTACCSEFGAVRTKQLIPRVPPQPISGRWGQASNCESFLLPWTSVELQFVFREVVGKRGYYKDSENLRLASSSAPVAASRRGIKRKTGDDIIGNDQSEAFNKMWGAWSQKGSLGAILQVV